MLEPCYSVAEIRQVVREARSRGLRVGFVPTMGALHDGHVRLIEGCRSLVDFVVVSIFVNPTQFGPNEDLARYPRPLANDLLRSSQAGADAVFVPGVETIYPAGSASTFVEVPHLSDILEGASRPGHFRGVATVVLKLFEIVAPDVAVFGQKDYQQQVVIKRMVADLHLPVEIVTLSTVREPDGLAMSSRNVYLKPEERRAATVLFRGLSQAAELVAAGERDLKRVRHQLLETLGSERAGSVDYAVIADSGTLEPLDQLADGRRAVAVVAVRFGTTRLIDNMVLSG
jgi:pantoate--beta-alanine ligase